MLFDVTQYERPRHVFKDSEFDRMFGMSWLIRKDMKRLFWLMGDDLPEGYSQQDRKYDVGKTSLELLQDIRHLQELIMPKNKAKKQDKPSWNGFVRCQLTPEDVGAIQEMTLNQDEIFNGIIHAVEAGHKVTFSYNDRTDKWNVSFTGVEGKHAGWCLTSFASSLELAFVVQFYKHFVLFDGQWPLDGGTNAELDFG